MQIILNSNSPKAFREALINNDISQAIDIIESLIVKSTSYIVSTENEFANQLIVDYFDITFYEKLCNNDATYTKLRNKSILLFKICLHSLCLKKSEKTQDDIFSYTVYCFLSGMVFQYQSRSNKNLLSLIKSFPTKFKYEQAATNYLIQYIKGKELFSKFDKKTQFQIHTLSDFDKIFNAIGNSNVLKIEKDYPSKLVHPSTTEFAKQFKLVNFLKDEIK